ncbi:MAG: alanine racemase [Treponema sp.]|nr:alanine racemase [Treponema sp.]
MRATRAIVHLDRFLCNLRAVQERVGRRKICVPVKADAYGHGAAAIARSALAAGAAFPPEDVCLGVACVDEGVSLRNEGIEAPILLFSQPLTNEIYDIFKYKLIPFVSDGEFITALENVAKTAGRRLPVHLKVDTGMGRMGCAPKDAPALARHIAASAALEYAGTATHLAAADSAAPEDIAFTKEQIARFTAAVDCLRAAGVDPGIVHAANSGAVILHPDAWFDMVRPGIFLYGYNTVSANKTAETAGTIDDITTSSISTADETAAGLALPPLRAEPVMELRTNVAFIRRVKKGEAVSYGRTWTAGRDTEIAVLPLGYADGLPRLASNRWQAVIGGRSYPLVGRICMDQCMADIGPGSEVRRWDEAVIFGGPALDAAELARVVGTIPYEITCNISKRVPRIYD